jgi:hypothetical protein
MIDWSVDFDALPPIKLDDSRTLSTLADCRAYILALPKREQALPRWQVTAATLLKAAEHGGPFRLIARIAMSRALQGVDGVGPAPEPLDDAPKSPRWQKQRKRSPWR